MKKERSLCLVLLFAFGALLLESYKLLSRSIHSEASSLFASVEAPRNPLISVVIPAYNSGKYLERCIKTLQNQTLQDLEFIFVDDCSTDNSVEAIKEHRRDDPRIRLITNAKNSGPGVSRNAGIAASQGAYVGFMDPDDHLDSAFYETLYKAATKGTMLFNESTCFDIAKGQLVSVLGNKVTHNTMVERSLSRAKVYMYFFSQHITAIYKKSLLDAHPDARYGNSSSGEDVVFIAKIAFYAKSIVTTNKAMYFYDKRTGSLSVGSEYNVLLGIYLSHRDIIEFYRERGNKAALRARTAWSKGLIDVALARYKRFAQSQNTKEKALYKEVESFRKGLEGSPKG